MSTVEQIARQQGIVDRLQGKLDEASEDEFADAERLGDLAYAVSMAADALESLHRVARYPEIPFAPMRAAW